VSTIVRISSRRLQAGFAAATIVFALAGCASGKWGFPYKAPIQQGNWVTSEQVALLQTGMTREQVRFALGSPTLTSVLHAERWDFPYYYKPGYGKSQERKFTVWFKDDKLVRWQGDEQPDLQPFQLANQDIKRSEAENRQTLEDAQRAKSDGDRTRGNVTITPPAPTDSSTPGAIPVPGSSSPQPL